MYSFPDLESVCCSMSNSNCCFLICRQISQEVGQVFWYFHLFKNFPQFVVIHIIKGFGVVNKAEVDVFLELYAFSMSQRMFTIWSLVPLPLLNPACRFGSSWFTYCWSLVWRILSIILLACEMSTLCGSLSILWHCLSLRLEWKLTFSSPVVTDKFSKFAGILSAALSQHHLLGFEIAQLESHHLH